jgi:hypothetical protein
MKIVAYCMEYLYLSIRRKGTEGLVGKDIGREGPRKLLYAALTGNVRASKVLHSFYIRPHASKSAPIRETRIKLSMER